VPSRGATTTDTPSTGVDALPVSAIVLGSGLGPALTPGSSVADGLADRVAAGRVVVNDRSSPRVSPLLFHARRRK